MFFICYPRTIIHLLPPKDNHNIFLGRTNIEETKKKYLEFLSKEIDFNDIDLETAKLIGMQRWDEESKLWLFPAYLYSIIPNGLEVVAIDGTKEIWNGKQDDDCRFGALAYGLILEEMK